MTPLPLPLARSWARSLRHDLAAHVERIEIVGSIRREREWVGDLELLAEPNSRTEPDLFHPADVPDIEPVARALRDRGTILKSGDRFIQVRLDRGPAERAADRSAKLDLFLCHEPAQWGALKVIRTGPADYSRICVTRLRKRGWYCRRGAVWAPDDELPPPNLLEADHDTSLEIDGRGFTRLLTPTEDDFFTACEMDGAPPQKRDEVVARYERLRDGRRR